MISATINAIVTVDVGTSSLRSSVYDLSGRCLYTSQKTYSPIFLGQNRVEQEVATWQRAVYKTLSDVGAYCREHRVTISLLSVTSQRASIIPIDADGNPLYRSIMWQDKRSITESEFLTVELGLESVYQKTGLRIDSYFSAPKILWLQKNEPEIFQNAHAFIGVQDYIVMLITGELVTDASQATRTLMMNLASRSWDADMLDTIGLKAERLPRIIEPGSVGGTICADLAKKTGIPAGTPVVLAGGDQACAAMALGMVTPGQMVSNTGTGAFTLGYSSTVQLHPEQKTLCSAGTIPGSYFIEAGLITGGGLVQWFVEQFYLDVPEENNFDRLFAEAATSPSGANNVILLPHFKGASAPFWNPKAKGIFFNLTLSSTRADMARAILEGISCDMAMNLELIRSLIDADFKGISIGGGMTRRELFNQMQADMYNAPVWVAESTEATSEGAWMSGVVALGAFENHCAAYQAITNKDNKRYEQNSSTVAVYQKLQKDRILLYNALANDPKLYDSFL